MLQVKKRNGSNVTNLSWEYIFVGDNIYSASFVCGKGHEGTLLDHVILDNGKVEPSVVCSLCDFHEYITLEGWNPKGPKIEGYV